MRRNEDLSAEAESFPSDDRRKPRPLGRGGFIHPLDFFKQGPAILFGFGIVNKNSATTTGNLFCSVFPFCPLTFPQGSPTANTLSPRKEPSLNWSNNVFKHLQPSFSFWRSRYSCKIRAAATASSFSRRPFLFLPASIILAIASLVVKTSA